MSWVPVHPVILLLLSAGLVVTGEDPLLVRTSYGQVQGVLVNGSRVFRGIPYAAPPLGEEGRFRPPRRHTGWDGTLAALDFGPSCVSPRCWESENLTRMSEDCLTINVITPQGPGPYPVMVYFHAGEFHCGTSNDAESNWLNFADDLVFVTMNYRVGPLGFLAGDELRARDPRNGTGNYGLLDQRFALEWVQENIAAFGGNPRNVVIWGESSGGTSVAFHLTAHGRAPSRLFRRAILQSPGLTQVKSFEDATENFEWTLAVLSAQASPNCTRGPGYTSFQAVGLYVEPPVAALRRSGNDTLAFARAWCDARLDCAGFWREGGFTTYVAAAQLWAYDMETFAGGDDSVTYLKSGPQGAPGRLSCLLSAEAQLLNGITELMPRDDTFQTDAWAPVLDGVDLSEEITSLVARGSIATGVDLLLGTNLDEGTEFMSLTPPLACDANASVLAAWADDFYGPALGPQVPQLYLGSLLRPLPACGIGGRASDVPGEQAIPYNAAMRSAGDAAIRCPTWLLAQKATGRSFIYHFSVTPTYSVNFGNTSVVGAFHGAEVPFVFGDAFELSTDHERRISNAMGCYWRSFAWHGDPAVEACGNVAWPHYKEKGHPVLELGDTITVQYEDKATNDRCELFELRGLRTPRSGGTAALYV